MTLDRPNTLRRKLTRGLGVLATLGAIFAICGCTSVSRVSAELVRGQLRFAYCDEYSPTEIEVTAGNSAHWWKSEVVWRDTGTTPLKPGEIVTYGVAPSSYSEKIPPSPFDPRTSMFEIVFRDPKTINKMPGQSGVFDGRKLVNGKWLNWNGNLTSKPCDG